jgi:hypothetical protein
MQKEKIKMSETDIIKSRREKNQWEVEKENHEISLMMWEKQLDNKLPIEQVNQKISESEVQIMLHEQNIATYKEQLKRDIPMKSLRTSIQNARDQMERLSKNIKVREKELREGYVLDINTGKPIEREVKEENGK